MCKNRQENRQGIINIIFFNALQAKFLPKGIGKFRQIIGKFQANKID